MAAILVVGDDFATARAITASGGDALDRLAASAFDVVTLDRMLPDMEGLAVVGALRGRGSRVPMLPISALGDVDQRIAGLRAGGDDYLTKPFAPDETAMQVQALLRRAAAAETALAAGDIRIDLIRREVVVAGRPVRLLPMEYRLLEFLVRHAGQTVSRRMLSEQAWNYHFDPSPNPIKVHIARLSQKIETPNRPSAISTVEGEGYRRDAG